MAVDLFVLEFDLDLLVLDLGHYGVFHGLVDSHVLEVLVHNFFKDFLVVKLVQGGSFWLGLTEIIKLY